MRESTSSVGHFAISYPENWDFLQHPGGQRDSTIVAAIAHPSVTKLGVIVFFRKSAVRYNSIDEVAKWGEEVGHRAGYREISAINWYL